MIRPILAIALTAATAFAAPAARHDPAGEEQVARQLRGLVPGQPQTCVTPERTGSGSHYGNTFLIEGRGGTLYRAQFQGGCEAPEEDALITRRTGSSICRGDIAEVRDLTSGFTRGSCIFSDFTPYRKP